MSATNVGVLELTIESNASSVATSLGGLADALTRVKEAVGTNSFGLGEVGKQLNAFAKQVVQAKSTVSVLKTISEFGNALSKLSKIGQFSVDTESFEKLKTAVSGFSIGNIGSQMNQLRLAMSGTWGDGKSAQSMSDLHDRLQAFANDTPVLLDFAMAMKEASSSLTEMNQSVTASGDWRMSMMGVSSSESVSTGANVAAGLETGMESGRESLVAVATELADAMIEVFRSRLEINSPSKVTTRFGEYTGEGLAVGLQNSMPEVVRATGDITDSIIEKMGEITEREKYIGLDMNQFLPDTVSSLPGIFRDMSDTVAQLSDSVGVTLPKMQQMSSEEMVVAGNAREATAAIDGLMKRLNSGKGWNGEKLDGFKNLAEFINFSQGIGMKFTSQSGGADELLKNAYRLNGTYTETEHVVSQVKTGIDEAVDSMRQGNIESSQWYQNAVKLNKEMAEKYAPNRNQTFEEWYNGFRPGTGYVKNDLMSKWLHGEGTKNEQQFALEQTARHFKISVEEVKANIDELEKQYSRFNNMANQGQEAQTATQKFFDNLGIPQTNAADMVKNLVGDVSQVDLMEAKLQGLQQSLTEDIQNNKLSAQQIADRAIQIQNLKEKIQQLKDAQGEANESAKESTSAWKTFKSGVQEMLPTLTGLLKRFKSIATMRALRYVIRQISAGFSEGVQNVYQYSKVVGTNLAPAMDNAKSSLNQLKNSIGAAVSPLITALVPALQTVVNWLITGINYINQFFALLNGQTTWTKALYNQSEAYEDATKNAKKAGSAVKDLLADWDELNIIQSNSGSGTGSDTTTETTDYTKMFEEVGEYADWVKRIADGIKDEFGDIWTLVKKIAVAILGWKISSAFAGILGTLGSLLAALGIVDLEFHIVTIFDRNFLNTGDEGWLVGDILTTLLGGVLMKKVLSNVLGGAAAKVAIPLTLAVSALAGITTLLGDNDTSAISPEALELSALNALKGGALAGYLFYQSGFTGGLSFGVGTAATLFWMGINIGMKAIDNVMDTREITQDTIKANFLSAGLVGAGLALGEAILGGTVGTVLGVGIGGTVLTLGALFAIEALLQRPGEKHVHWGDINATTEDIRSFVEDEVFSVAPTVEISLANAKFKELGDQREELRKSAEDVIGTLESVKLGLIDSAEADLKAKVKTLVKNFNQTSSTYQDALKIAFELVPVKSGNEGTDKSKEILSNSESRWAELNGIMTKLGDDLGKAFDIAYDKSLTETVRKDAQKSIDKISNMMTQVAEAISGGQARAKAVHSINMQIAELSHESFDELIQIYKEEKDKLVDQLTQIGSDAAEGLLAQQYAYEKLAEYALKEAGGNVQDETYKYYLQKAKEAEDDYNAAIKNIGERAEKQAAETLESSVGQQKIRDSLLGILSGKISDKDIEEAIASAGYDPDVFGENFVKLIKSGNTSKAKDDFGEFIDAMLLDFLGTDNYQTFKDALDEGIIKYSDLFDKEFLHGIGEKLQLADQSSEAEDMWDQFVDGLYVPETEVEMVVDDNVSEPIQAPGIDPSFFNSSLIAMQENAKSAVDYIKSVIESLNNFSVGVSVTELNKAPEGGVKRYMQTRASGGFVRSGDLVMANENGNFEMMGRMGNQPVVANNQQIVNGISQGVATANGDVVSELRTLAGMMQKMLNKEFVAKAIPGSDWGQHNSKSNDAWSRVNG